MGAPRGRKPLIASRRRVEDEGEEEADNVTAAVEEDSLSEGSIVSDADDDADAEGSDDSETEPPQEKDSVAKSRGNGRSEDIKNSSDQPTSVSKAPGLENSGRDTEAMMNGLQISENVGADEVHFDDLGKQPEVDASTGGRELQTNDSIGERRRKEHEEYKKKRDADPAFVPNRGGFFMHDHRSAAPGQNGFRPFGRGRGRGRGGVAGPFPAVRYVEHLVIYVL